MKKYLLQLAAITAGIIALSQITISGYRQEANISSVPESTSFDLNLQGETSGTGTYFEITDSDYLNVSLKSSEALTLSLSSHPKVVSLIIPASSVSSSQLTISGLVPNSQYYLFDNSYKNGDSFVSDTNGSHTFVQNLSGPHYIWLQETKGTVFMPEDCNAFGTFDSATSTCTLNQDVSQTIEITANNTTLDCDGHTISNLSTFGILLNNKQNATARNCVINNVSTGVSMAFSDNNTFINNNINNNNRGIGINSSNGNTISNNILYNNDDTGIAVFYSDGNAFIDNDISGNIEGIITVFSNESTISSNTLYNHVDSIVVSYSSDNIIDNNNIDLSSTTGINLIGFDGNTINNTIQNNLITNSGLYGITLANTQSNNVIDNVVLSNNIGLVMQGLSNGNNITDNTISSNGHGIMFFPGAALLDNLISQNTIEDSTTSGMFFFFSGDASNNKIFNNNFINNPAHISGSLNSPSIGSTLFDNGLPDGGNFWDDYDTPAEGCNDANNDRFCDAPRVINVIQQVKDNFPWTVRDGWEEPPPEPTIGEKSAELAKELLNSDYLYGGKGWDYNVGEFVAPNTIKTGYNFWNQSATTPGIDFGVGLDCSGLVMWSYNRSFDPQKSRFNNFVKAEGADEQFRQNTESISETDLVPGDVMFSDFDRNGFIDHVAMYVGESGGFDVVSAVDEDTGIVSRLKNDLKKSEAGFVAFKRVISALPPSVLVSAGSPVDLIVTDPEGFIITPDTIVPSPLEFLREIPGELYYSELEQGEDGRPIDQVYSYSIKTGDYFVKITTEPNALPTDTYDLTFTSGENTITLAENIPISDIPTRPYLVRSSEDGVIEKIVPVSVRIEPETINLSSKGIVTAFLQTESGFGISVRDIDVATIRLSDVQPTATFFSNENNTTTLIAKFRTQDLTNAPVGEKVSLTLTGRLFDRTKIEGSDITKVIKRGSRFSLITEIFETLANVLTGL